MSIILNKEDVENLLKMMRSSDEENQFLALTTIENLDYRKNLGAIVILYRNGYSTFELWFEHAPKCTKQVIQDLVGKGNIIQPSYHLCFLYLKNYNIPEQQTKLVVEFYIEEVKDKYPGLTVDEVYTKLFKTYERTNKKRTACKS